MFNNNNNNNNINSSNNNNNNNNNNNVCLHSRVTELILWYVSAGTKEVV